MEDQGIDNDDVLRFIKHADHRLDERLGKLERIHGGTGAQGATGRLRWRCSGLRYASDGGRSGGGRAAATGEAATIMKCNDTPKGERRWSGR